MKALLTILFLVAMIIPAFADEYVQGYYRKNGTYVQPHYRSSADGNPYNNYSSRGNVNPYTGQVGTKDPNDYYSQGSSDSFYSRARRNRFSN